MREVQNEQEHTTGSADLRLGNDLRGLLHEHVDHLRGRYAELGWGGRVGFGSRPALVVLDLALAWTTERGPVGSNLDSVVDGTARILEAARAARIPIFFTTGHYDPTDPPSPGRNKLNLGPRADFPIEEQFRLDPRLEHRSTEKVIAKPYASAFKGTNLLEMLAAAGVDTLIVTGCSTSHCVYATCRDARDSFRVIVPREAVGERSELMHEVFLFDIDLALGDVMPVDDVIARLKTQAAPPAPVVAT
jgi:nicotinamidase-related amidase